MMDYKEKNVEILIDIKGGGLRHAAANYSALQDNDMWQRCFEWIAYFFDPKRRTLVGNQFM